MQWHWMLRCKVAVQRLAEVEEVDLLALWDYMFSLLVAVALALLRWVLVPLQLQALLLGRPVWLSELQSLLLGSQPGMQLAGERLSEVSHLVPCWA